MERERLVIVRNMLNEKAGKYLIEYLSDYITSNACMAREASEIKGMCELLEQVKRIPSKVEKL